MVLCSSARCAGACLPARRTGTATPRSRWRSGRSIAGRTPPSIPRCAITQPKLTGFSSSSGSLANGPPAPPHLTKADKLGREVYWKAPGLSKQRIVGWRDRAELPTDINYHRDHLGIVQNNFGRAIRLGEEIGREHV